MTITGLNMAGLDIRPVALRGELGPVENSLVRESRYRERRMTSLTALNSAIAEGADASAQRAHNGEMRIHCSVVQSTVAGPMFPNEEIVGYWPALIDRREIEPGLGVEVKNA